MSEIENISFWWEYVEKTKQQASEVTRQKTSKNVWDSLNNEEEKQKEITRLYSMVWDIEVVEIWNRIKSEIGKKDPSYLRNEIKNYYDFEERLEQPRVRQLYEHLLKWFNLLPTELLKEINADNLLDEENPKVLELTDVLFLRLRPSEILKNINYFRKLASDNSRKQHVIKNLLKIYAENLNEEWISTNVLTLSTIWECEIPSYLEIEEIPEEIVREMMLSCIDKWFLPSEVIDYKKYFYYIYNQWTDCIKWATEDFNNLTGKENQDVFAYICLKNSILR